MAFDDKPNILKPLIFSIAAILGLFAVAICGYFVYEKLKPKPAAPVVHLWILSDDRIAVDLPDNLVDGDKFAKRIDSEQADWQEKYPGSQIPVEVALHYDSNARMSRFYYGMSWATGRSAVFTGIPDPSDKTIYYIQNIGDKIDIYAVRTYSKNTIMLDNMI